MGTRIKIHGPIGIGTFVLAVVMMHQGTEPFTTYFYCFAWWSYILFADALVYYIKGESLLLTRTRTFFMMIPLSIFVWCVFEGFNVRLDNWHYINVPHEAWKRWFGYAVSYGAVLPGLCETTHLVGVMGWSRGVSWRRLHPSPQLLRVLMFLGGMSLIATLLTPRYCFPLVWVGFALLIDPLNYRYGGDSLLRDIEQGEVQRLLTLLTAGLICGFLWELWNFWAQTKWIYTIPFFEGGKLFEMPVLGFLGFPPFTVSVYIIYRFLILVGQRSGTWARGTCWLLVTLFCCLVFAGIDHYTVVSHIPLVRDMPGVQEKWKRRLRDRGIEKVHELLRRGEGGLVNLGIPPDEAERLIDQAECITLKGLGMENYRLLRKVGVMDLADLAYKDPSTLYGRLEGIHHRSHRTFTPALVRLWVQEAQGRAD